MIKICITHVNWMVLTELHTYVCNNNVKVQTCRLILERKKIKQRRHTYVNVCNVMYVMYYLLRLSVQYVEDISFFC